MEPLKGMIMSGMKTWVVVAALGGVWGFSTHGEISSGSTQSIAEMTIPENSATVPSCGKNESHLKGRHAKHLAQIKERKPDLLFLGDSITDFWTTTESKSGETLHKRGLAVWNKYYAARHALNAGICGDTTQGLLWRLQNGLLDGIAPKVAVLTIGHNNSSNSQQEISDGQVAILREIRRKCPLTQIIFLPHFPSKGSNGKEGKCVKAAEMTRDRVKQDPMIHYLDLNEYFLGVDGTLKMELIPDGCHPAEPGYQVWAENMEPLLKQLLIPTSMARTGNIADMEIPENTATISDGKKHEGSPLHSQHLAQIKARKPDILFVGDSITHGWTLTKGANESKGVKGLAVWKKWYEGRNALNAGISGDTTQGVLWRLQNGLLDGISPTVAIVTIGHNNHGPPKEDSDGQVAVLREIRRRCPNTHIIFLPHFPSHGVYHPESDGRVKIARMTRDRVKEDSMIHYLDINEHFLDQDGALKKEYIPDGCHPAEPGYQVWAENMEPLLKQLLKR